MELNYDIGKKLIERQYNPSQLEKNVPDPSPLEKIRLFIAFRMLLYADVCHDFLGDRTQKAGWNQTSKKMFSESQVNIMYDDIEWYIRELLGPFGNLPSGSDKQSFITMFKTRNLIVWARKSMMKNSTKSNPPDVITSDDIAKKVSNFVIAEMLRLKPIQITKLLGCGYDFNIIKIMAILSNFNQEYWNASEPLKLCVDMTTKGRNLLPIYTIIFRDHFRRKAFKQCGSASLASLIKYGLDQTQPLIKEGEIKFVTTPAQKFDSAETDTIENLLEVEDKSIYNFKGITGINDEKFITILFFGIPIIVYKFTPQTTGTFIDKTAGINLTIQKYFKIQGLGTRNSNLCSVSKIATDMTAGGPQLNPQKIPISAFKTLGDFLQIISYLIIEESANNTAFITGDIICGQIASVFTKSAVCEVEDKGDPYGGISIYLSESQQKLWSEVDPDISAVLQEILTQSQVGDFLLETFLEDNDDPDFLNEIIKNNPSLVLQDGQVGGKRKQASFGKKLNNMSNNELKNKLKAVRISITKKIKEKRYPLTRKELEQKAKQFTKLQLEAKNKNIRITYINRDGFRKYKSYKRLISDLSKQNNFGGIFGVLTKRASRQAAKNFKPMIKYVAKEVKNEVKNEVKDQAKKTAIELKKRAIIEAKTKMYNKNNVKVFKDKNNNRIITATRMG